MSYLDNLRDERDEAISLVAAVRKQRDNCYGAVERLDAAHRDARAEADRLRGLVDEAVNVILDIGAHHILDAAASERCEQFYARAALDAEDKENQDDIGRREKKG